MFDGLIIDNRPEPVNREQPVDPYHIIVTLIPNLYQMFDGSTYIKILKRTKIGCEYTSYKFSNNIAFLRIAEYVSSDGKSIIWFNLGTEVMHMEKSNITGLKLLDKLAQIGVDFCIDAPKYKRGEAINQLIFKNLSLKKPILLEDEVFKNIKETCVK